MFHVAAKVLFFLFQPSSLAVLLVGLGIVLLYVGRRRGGSIAAALGMLWLVGAGLFPVGNLLINHLEDRFPVPSLSSLPPVSGIIMLGGFEDILVSRSRGGLILNDAAERLTESLLLAKRLPGAKVVFTGGWGGLGQGVSADDEVRNFLQDNGIAPERIITEGRSRNTFENAQLTHELLRPEPGSRWLLVTSAWHMPRSVGTFRQAGFDVIAYPVDFRTPRGGGSFRLFQSIPEGLSRCDLAIHEYIGLMMYRLTGRSNALYPSP